MQLASWLEDVAVDLIDVSTSGNVHGVRIPIGPEYHVPFAPPIRQGAQIPTATVGLITEVAQAEQIIRGGDADIVLMSREPLRQPHWSLLRSSNVTHFISTILVACLLSPAMLAGQSAASRSLDVAAGVLRSATHEGSNTTSGAAHVTAADAYWTYVRAGLDLGRNVYSGRGGLCYLASDGSARCIAASPSHSTLSAMAGAGKRFERIELRALIGSSFAFGDGAARYGVQLLTHAALGPSNSSFLPGARARRMRGA